MLVPLVCALGGFPDALAVVAMVSSQVYEQLAQPIVRNVTQGFNGTLFAYGQTSSGKTYTVMGDDENLGLLFLALQDVFDAIAEDPSRVYTLRVQYIEIYNEVVNDLLNPKKVRAGLAQCITRPPAVLASCIFSDLSPATRGFAPQTHLRIYEDPKRGPQIRNVTEKTLRDADDAVSVISTGEKNRHISATLMNRQSSRSHTVCRLELTSRSVDAKATGRGSGRNRQTYSVRESMLCVVDLAGSERASKTGATGARLKEASHINKSLMTLGTIISQLSQANNKKHPPFRDSKLTRLLSNALGGNALTALVCCVSPAVRNREETRWVRCRDQHAWFSTSNPTGHLTCVLPRCVYVCVAVWCLAGPLWSLQRAPSVFRTVLA